MASVNVDDLSAPPPRLPHWRTASAPRSFGRNKPDWSMLVPMAASLAANREVLFSQFGDTVPLVHCLRNVETSGWRAADAVVAVADVLYTDVKALLAAHGVSVKLVSVEGPGTREQCLAAGLAALSQSSRYVLVHDIHRPLASADLADRILDGLRSGSEVVVPALAMVDSVKTVDAAGAVTETLDRTLLQSAQFPRGFDRRRLAQILATVGDGDFDYQVLTGRVGVTPTVIDGDPDAFALDIPRDVALAEAIHSCRLAQQR